MLWASRVLTVDHNNPTDGSAMGGFRCRESGTVGEFIVWISSKYRLPDASAYDNYLWMNMYDMDAGWHQVSPSAMFANIVSGRALITFAARANGHYDKFQVRNTGCCGLQ